MHHVITAQHIIYVTVLTMAILLLLKIINNRLESNRYQSCYSFNHDISPRCGSLTVREKQKHSRHHPACEDMTWAPTLQLSFCPICWREEETVCNCTGGQHHIRGVCPFLCSQEKCSMQGNPVSHKAGRVWLR